MLYSKAITGPCQRLCRPANLVLLFCYRFVYDGDVGARFFRFAREYAVNGIQN